MPHVRHDFGIDLYLGCYSKDTDEVDYSENRQALALFMMLETAGFNLERVKRVKDAQWTKLVLNVPFFLTCVLQGKSVSEVLHTSELYAEMMTLRQELITAAGLAGNEPNLAYISTIDEQLAKMAVTPLSSAEEFAKRMCAELEPNAGALLTALSLKGIELPTLKASYDTLKKKAT